MTKKQRLYAACKVIFDYSTVKRPRFYREDKSRSNTTNGTGLGLAMVKWIVQLHHGEIKVFSEKGAGSEFVFYIPNELNFKGK